MKFEVLYRSNFARGVLRFVGGNLFSVALQAAQFVLLARIFGAAQFGEIALANAIAAIALPVAGLGYGNVMLMEVARDRTEGATWVGNAIVSTVFSGGVLIVTCFLSYDAFIEADAPLFLLGAVLLSELLLLRFNTLAAQLAIAMERFKQAVRFNVLASFSKLAATCAVLLFEVRTLAIWSCLLVISTALAGLVSVFWMRRSVTNFSFDFSRFKKSYSTGVGFAFGISAKSVYTDGDKVILGRVSTSEVLGAYASAYRLAVIAFMPVRALLDVSAAKFFRSGDSGLSGSLAYGLRLLFLSLPYAVCATISLYFLSPIVPLILGASFAESVEVLKALSPLPLIQCVHYIFSDVLTTSGRQWLRSALQFVTVVTYVALALLLIPDMEWKGAAITCVASEALLAALVVFASVLCVRKEANR